MPVERESSYCIKIEDLRSRFTQPSKKTRAVARLPRRNKLILFQTRQNYAPRKIRLEPSRPGSLGTAQWARALYQAQVNSRARANLWRTQTFVS